MIYQIRFHRYKNHQSRISGILHMNADNFRDAHDKAEMRMVGMKDADPDSTFSIVSIETHDARGESCEGGILTWETASEMSARIAAKSAS